MREPTFWILTALAARPLHGYGLMQQTVLLSDGQVRLQPGTLYAALDRLVSEGLVQVDRDEVVDGRTRRYYRITDEGAAALHAAAKQLRAGARAAATQLAARRKPGPGLASAMAAR